MDNLAKLRWVKLFRPEVYEKTRAFLEPTDYLNYRLTGRVAANACTIFPMQVTDNRDPARIAYAPSLLRWSGIDADKFPELLPMDATVGPLLPDVAATLGLAPGTQVLTGVNDTHAGAFGCGSFQGTHAGMVLGNSGVMVTHAPRKKTDIRTGLFTLPSPLPDRYLVTGECGVAGRALEHFLEYIIFTEDAFGALCAEFPYKRLEEVVAASPPGSNGVLFLPWMSGAHMPAMDGDMRGGFLNVSLNTRRPDLARAVLEGIIFQYRHMGEAGKKFTGRDFTHYTLYGGGAFSDTWSQTMADALQLPIHRMAHPRLTNCIGLGMLAFHHLGHISLDDIAQSVAIGRVFQPNPALRALYDDRHAAMTLAFKQNRRLFRLLNRAPHPAAQPAPALDE
jgi:xylulokinase